LLTVTAFGIWLPLHLQSTAEQKRAVRRFHGVWGRAVYDYQTVTTAGIVGESWVPAQLRAALGDDFFHSVVSARAFGGYEDLRKMHRLKSLKLHDVRMTDAEVSSLANLTRLRELHITTSERITPPATGPPAQNQYAALGGGAYMRIRAGWPYSRRLGDSTLQTLARLPRLEVLEIEGTEFTPEGIAVLAQSRSLRELRLATCDPSVTADIADVFRRSGRVRKLTIIKWSEASGEETVAQWSE
jgi:hypothetical protein